MNPLCKIIGLMSGTSLDGIDAAYIETDGLARVAAGPAMTIPYPTPLREAIRGVLGGNGPVAEVERTLTEAHAEAALTLAGRHGLSPDLIGFHGHTILHRPREGRTWQIGDGALLAKLTGIDVVNDFRSADVAEGGEGAPLVPLYHAALASGLERPLAIVNIGGVANVTWIGGTEARILAFDTGPGNAPIDDWARSHRGLDSDLDGALARAGRPDPVRLGSFTSHPFFARKPPKSLDRDDFSSFRPDGLSVEDGAATLTAMTAAGIAMAARHFPEPPRLWLATGGGRHNPALMTALRERLDTPLLEVEAVGWDGDALEAQAFAYLAFRAVRGLPLSLPTTTGVKRAVTGGRLWRNGTNN